MSDLTGKDKEQIKVALEHAWDWFSLHATQRLQTVNFYLVAVAFLTAAFVTATKEQMYALCIGIALLGAFISYFFYRMERRIRSLIKAAEDVINPIEAYLAGTLSLEALKIVERVEGGKPGEWKYSKVFRYLYFLSGASFAAGALSASWAIATNSPSPRVFDIVAQMVVAVFLFLFGYEMLVTSPEIGKERGSLERILLSSLGAVSIAVGISVFAYLIFWRMTA